jgi:hypothetical protein
MKQQYLNGDPACVYYKSKDCWANGTGLDYQCCGVDTCLNGSRRSSEEEKPSHTAYSLADYPDPEE